MAEEPKSQPPSHHSNKWYNAHPEAKRPEPTPALPTIPKKRLWDHIVDVVEEPLVLTALAIVVALVDLVSHYPTLVLIGVLVLLGFHRSRKLSGKSIWKVQGPAYVLLLIGTSCILFALHIFLKRSTAQFVDETVSKITEALGQTQVQVSSEMFRFLPLSIPPHSTVHILALSEDQRAELSTYQNDSNAEELWPERKNILPPELATLYRLSNHGKAIVFNVDVAVTVHFPQEKTSTEVWEIESLAPGESAPLYIVNQSRDFVVVPFPDSASLEVQGIEGRRKVKLLKHGLLSWIKGGNEVAVPIPPSVHVWLNGKITDSMRQNQPK